MRLMLGLIAATVAAPCLAATPVLQQDVAGFKMFMTVADAKAVAASKGWHWEDRGSTETFNDAVQDEAAKLMGRSKPSHPVNPDAPEIAYVKISPTATVQLSFLGLPSAIKVVKIDYNYQSTLTTAEEKQRLIDKFGTEFNPLSARPAFSDHDGESYEIGWCNTTLSCSGLDPTIRGHVYPSRSEIIFVCGDSLAPKYNKTVEAGAHALIAKSETSAPL